MPNPKFPEDLSDDEAREIATRLYKELYGERLRDVIRACEIKGKGIPSPLAAAIGAVSDTLRFVRSTEGDDAMIKYAESMQRFVDEWISVCRDNILNRDMLVDMVRRQVEAENDSETKPN